MELWRYGVALERLGERYRLDGVLGSGGMADVCSAYDEQARRRVAIKVIKADELGQKTLNRFLQEARHAAKLHHPNILRTYGEVQLELLNASSGSVVPYIVMEYAQGGDLQKRLTPNKPYNFAETLHVFAQLCTGVAYAHERGVIHRDLKPQNILFRRLPDGSEQAAVSDFGLAVAVGATHQTYARGGTLPYMAPEQLRGQAVPASDIFALGVILYQLCTGQRPFRRTLEELRRGDLPTTPIYPSHLNPALPSELDRVILRALAPDPERRYADALTLWEAVKSACTPTSTARRETYVPPRASAAGAASSRNRPEASVDVESAASVEMADDVWSEDSDAPDVAPVTDKSNALGQERRTEKFATVQPTRMSDDSSYMPTDRPISTDKFRRPPSEGTRQGREQRSGTTSASMPSVSVRPLQHTRARGSWWVPALLLTLILVLGASLWYGLPLLAKSGPSQRNAPQSQNQDFTVQLTHTPSNDQLVSQQLSGTSTEQKDAIATGNKQIPATSAKGRLTFLNGSFTTPITIGPGATIKAKNGMVMVTDAEVTVPTANPDTGDGQASVRAHAGSPGKAGNIAPLDVDMICCTSDKTMFVKNADAFTGGRDAKEYHFVTQKDVERVVAAERLAREDVALKDLNGNLKQNEVIAGTAVCDTRGVSEQPLGDQGHEIARSTITISSKCQGEVYNENELRQLIEQRLAAQAPTGMVPTNIKLEESTNATKPGDLPSLNVKASWQWKERA